MVQVMGNAIMFNGFKVVLQMQCSSETFKNEYLADMANELANCTTAVQAANVLVNCNNDGSWVVVDGQHYVEVHSLAN